MIDLKLLRDNPDFYLHATRAKGFDDSIIKDIVDLDKQRRELLQAVETLRASRNQLGKDDISKGKKLKNDLKAAEGKLDIVSAKLDALLLRVPNPSAPDVLIGTPDQNQIVKTVGQPPKFDFPVRDHVDIGLLTQTIDLERGAKVTQSGFYYLKSEGALLELALVQFAIRKLASKGFTPVITPNLAKERMVTGCGFQARSDKERQIYSLENEDLDMIATAEITLVGQHADEFISESVLPLKYAGFSSCYRTEIGSYGKDVRGILRVHEFRKVEMVVFCLPEDSDAWHEKLLAIEEEIWQELKLPYQVVKMATGDLGNAASRKYDLEAWIPSQNRYREVTSTSNTTDFQTRRLNIKTKTSAGNIYLHSLNGTVVALGRAMIAIYENYQNPDGSVIVPEVLRPYLGADIITVKP